MATRSRPRSLSELPGHLRVPILKRKDTERTQARLEAGVAGMEELRVLREQQQQLVGDTVARAGDHRRLQRRHSENCLVTSLKTPRSTGSTTTSPHATVSSWQSATSLASISEEGGDNALLHDVDKNNNGSHQCREKQPQRDNEHNVDSKTQNIIEEFSQRLYQGNSSLSESSVVKNDPPCTPQKHGSDNNKSWWSQEDLRRSPSQNNCAQPSPLALDTTGYRDRACRRSLSSCSDTGDTTGYRDRACRRSSSSCSDTEDTTGYRDRACRRSLSSCSDTGDTTGYRDRACRRSSSSCGDTEDTTGYRDRACRRSSSSCGDTESITIQSRMPSYRRNSTSMVHDLHSREQYRPTPGHSLFPKGRWKDENQRRSSLSGISPSHSSEKEQALATFCNQNISENHNVTTDRNQSQISWDNLLKTIGISGSTTSLTSFTEDGSRVTGDDVFCSSESLNSNSNSYSSPDKTILRKFGRSQSFCYGNATDFSRKLAHSFHRSMPQNNSFGEESDQEAISTELPASPYQNLQPIMRRASMQCEAVLTNSDMSKRIMNPIQDVDINRLTKPGPVHAVMLQYTSRDVGSKHPSRNANPSPGRRYESEKGRISGSKKEQAKIASIREENEDRLHTNLKLAGDTSCQHNDPLNITKVSKDNLPDTSTKRLRSEIGESGQTEIKHRNGIKRKGSQELIKQHDNSKNDSKESENMTGMARTDQSLSTNSNNHSLSKNCNENTKAKRLSKSPGKERRTKHFQKPPDNGHKEASLDSNGLSSPSCDNDFHEPIDVQTKNCDKKSIDGNCNSRDKSLFPIVGEPTNSVNINITATSELHDADTKEDDQVSELSQYNVSKLRYSVTSSDVSVISDEGYSTCDSVGPFSKPYMQNKRDHGFNNTLHNDSISESVSPMIDDSLRINQDDSSRIPDAKHSCAKSQDPQTSTKHKLQDNDFHYDNVAFLETGMTLVWKPEHSAKPRKTFNRLAISSKSLKQTAV